MSRLKQAPYGSLDIPRICSSGQLLKRPTAIDRLNCYIPNQISKSIIFMEVHYGGTGNQGDKADPGDDDRNIKDGGKAEGGGLLPCFHRQRLAGNFL